MQNTKSLIYKKSQKRMWAYGIVVMLALGALLYVVPPAHDNDSHAITGTPVASDTTLSISLSSNILSLDITPTSSSGTFATTADDDTGASTAVIHVATNNITGYTLGIKASNPNSSTADKLISSNEKCENTPTSAKCAINSIPSPTSEADYIDSDNTVLNNTWGYLPSKYNSLDNTNYLPAPVAGDTIATTDAPNQENTIANDGTLLEDEYTIDYGMRIDYSPYAGTYSTNYNNQSYVITAVGNLVPYSVSYDANKPEQASATANVDNMPTAQAGNVSGGDTIAVLLSPKVPTLGNSNPSTGDYDYAGYVFAGWCTVQPEVPNEINGQPNTQGYQSCPINTQQPDQARLFQPGDNFGIDQTVDNTQILYATWGAPAKVTFDGNGGLVFNDTATDTTNTVTYIPTYADGKITDEKTNIAYTGAYATPAPLTTTPTNYIFKGWSTDATATTPTYTTEQDILTTLDTHADDDITLYAIWAYTTVITFDKNGADGTETTEPQIIEANTTAPLEQNVYTNTGYVLGSWNTVQTPTEQDPGETYADQANFTAGSQSADVTLYAQWKVPTLYDKVSAMSKGAQDAAALQATITAPTTTDPTTDTSNSGVYEYNTAVFGEASDASNANKIYYYRGVLEPEEDQGEYGSDGAATTYPNYVKLGNNTCWRIVRTTGSGGVKMIYNGVWNTTDNTCANAQGSAQYNTRAFNGSYNNAVYVGYTYNSAMTTSPASTTDTSVDTVFGSNADPTLNNTRSTIKAYIEDTWYTAQMKTATYDYTDKLEPSAGYCNDRTVYNTSGTQLDTITPQRNVEVRFGARIRVGANSAQKSPSLTCPRGDVDLYRYIGGGTSATSYTSNELRYPAALLTADEISLAGSGYYGILPYNAKSFLNSGSSFWALSPDYRTSNSRAVEFGLYSGGDLGGGNVYNTIGVRPAISLTPGTYVTGGNGTATSPWTINE